MVAARHQIRTQAVRAQVGGHPLQDGVRLVGRHQAGQETVGRPQHLASMVEEPLLLALMVDGLLVGLARVRVGKRLIRMQLLWVEGERLLLLGQCMGRHHKIQGLLG